MARVPAFARPSPAAGASSRWTSGTTTSSTSSRRRTSRFEGDGDGEIAFVAVKGFLDVRYGSRDGSACAEFSWEGYDER